MPMDDTDKSLIKGSVFFAVLFLIVYFYPFSWPFEGYSTQMERLQLQKDNLEAIKPSYEKVYPAPVPTVWGLTDEEAKGAAEKRALVAKLIKEYEGKIKILEERIKEKQAASKMIFARWTNVPQGYRREPGFYFAEMLDKVRNQVEVVLRRANVDNMDPNIGFGGFSGKYPEFTKEISEAYLRQLFIAQKVIQLCVEAKQAQFKKEVKDHRPDAYMKIISVAPESPESTGPFALINNPKYDPQETNPRSDKFQKYKVKKWDDFIMQYPIQILIQCDVDSFMRFLYSVRSEGQFLVIRNLQIISPSMKHSQLNQFEIEQILGTSGEDKLKFDDHHIWVRMSAAGMDFDPALIERYATKQDKRETKKRINRGRRGRRPARPSGH